MKHKNDQFLKLYDEVIAHFGSVNKLACLLGISRHAVYMWKKFKCFPKWQAYQIEKASNGRFPIKQLTSCNKKVKQI